LCCNGAGTNQAKANQSAIKPAARARPSKHLL
jgi:hypothetical protein